MTRGRKKRDELNPVERDRLTKAAVDLRANLLNSVRHVRPSSEDRQLCERQAQSLNAFGNLLKSLNNRKA